MADSDDNPVELILLPNINILLDRQGIVRVTYLGGSMIDVLDKVQEKEAIWRVTKGIKHPFLFSFESMVTITKEAKEYSVQVEMEQPFISIAVLVDNFAYQLLADFYFKFYKPKVNYKVFKDETKAVEWLLEEKTMYSQKENLTSPNNSFQ